MQPDPAQTIYYRRARFTTRLPIDRLYSPSHFWLSEEEQGLWRVGFTKLALRMLGELVELTVLAAVGDVVEVGQAIGSVEGFKAISDLYCVAEGEFAGSNPQLERDLTLADTRPYSDGWLYRVRGKPDASAVDVHGYVEFLNLTIDNMKEQQDARSKPC